MALNFSFEHFQKARELAVYQAAREEWLLEMLPWEKRWEWVRFVLSECDGWTPEGGVTCQHGESQSLKALREFNRLSC